MKNIKLIKILKLLSNKKLIKLKDFINTPYFNKDKKIGELIGYLIAHAPTYEVTKEECFQKVFPNSVYDSAKLRRLFSKAFKLTEKFIAYEALDAKPNIRHRVLSEFYEQNIEPTLFETHNKAWEESTEKLFSNTRLAELFMIKWQRWIFAGLLDEKKIRSKKTKTEESNLDDLWTSFEDFTGRLALDFFILKEEFRHVTSFGSIKFKQFFLLESILKAIEENETEFLNNVNISHIYLQYKLLMKPSDEKSLEALVKIRDTDYKLMHHEDIMKVCSAINLYYMRMFDTTLDLKYIEGRFENSFFRIKHHLAFREGFLIHYFFMSIVVLGLQLKRLDWVENFLAEYIPKLASAYKIPIGQLGQALLAFTNKNFEKALTILNSFAVNKNFFYYMRIRQLEIKIYYELENYEVAENLLNAFRAICSREKNFTPKIKKRGQGFANVIYHLMYFSKVDSRKISKLKNLKESIGENYSDPLWLLEKIEEKLNT